MDFSRLWKIMGKLAERYPLLTLILLWVLLMWIPFQPTLYALLKK